MAFFDLAVHTLVGECLLQSGFFLAAKEEGTVAVADNRVRSVLVDGFELALGLQDDGR